MNLIHKSSPSSGSYRRYRRAVSGFGLCALGLLGGLIGAEACAALSVTSAGWDGQRGRLNIDGTGDKGDTVTVVNTYATGQVLGTSRVGGRDGTWSISDRNPAPVPCAVTASAPGDSDITVNVSNAPANCAPKPGGNTAPVCIIDSPAGNVTISAGGSVSFSATVTDADNDPLTIGWNFPGGTPGSSSAEDPGAVTYNTAGVFVATLNASDGLASCAQQSRSVTVEDVVTSCSPANTNVSINTTSRNGCPDRDIVEQPQVAGNSYSVLAINDLGMHCGDLDTRIASILPPFQVLLTQVIQKGASPTLNPAGVEVYYSAASNPGDPVLNSNVFDGLMSNGETYKTNFWTDAISSGIYNAFYPFDIDALMSDDLGLPVPNIEDLYIDNNGNVVPTGTGIINAVQHAMPGIGNPYIDNTPQRLQEYFVDKPFFVGFPFGYVAADVNWYEGAGVPFAAFDDNGRENAYPLVRVQAMNAQHQVLSTVDTVLPISGEASCTNCHTTNADYISVHGVDNRTDIPTAALASAGIQVATSLDDPASGMPPRVSLEYAADINVLRLHDLRHGQSYVAPDGADDKCVIGGVNGDNGSASCLAHKALVDNRPTVCQVCHYTPALDLAHAGPQAGPPGSTANGRNQLAHPSNSRVMHYHHGSVPDLDRNGDPMFPDIDAPAQNASGVVTNQATRLGQLENSCYQCHPGTNVQCLRGAMFNGNMLCSDCHGSMLHVGDDFSRDVSPATPGAFILDANADFYDPTDPQPRVPWANEPGCGSCHTGDYDSNLAGAPNVMVNTADSLGNPDGIRLRMAYRVDNQGNAADAKATPIVPSNRRFAEPAVPASFNGFSNPGAGNPQLYRVSTGHGGVMCEGCHGATHAEWPNANPNSNDNITASQLQGHTGVLIECSTCHGTAMNGTNTLNGPHGMHPVGNDTNVSSGSAAGPQVSFVDGGHEHMNTSGCSACHGPGGRSSNQGTVLSVAKKDRRLNGRTIPAGTPIGCSICHGSGGGG